MKKIFNRKGVFAKSLSVWSAFAAVATTTAPAFAAGTAVLGGDAVLTGHTRASLGPDATATYAQFVADQGATTAVLDWSKFNVGAGKKMDFSGAGTTFFNLVDGAAGKSQIDGIISSGSGNVWVINPAGIAFGAGSTVDVGGLFAAAAGNISNADALRNGTVTMPSFSSFEGPVDASKGSFTADQVTLMGKTVVVNGGDFSNAKNLAVAAAGNVVVESVLGGGISVNLQDFVDKSDGVVELGDLLVEGDVRVVTDGQIESKGKVSAGSVYMKSGGDLTIKNNVSAHSGDLTLSTKDGDIHIQEKSVLLAEGAGATLLLQAGQNAKTEEGKYSRGGIDMSGEAIASGEGGSVTLYGGFNGIGDVDVYGSVKSSGKVKLFTDNGSINVHEGAAVSSSGVDDEESAMMIYTGVGSYSRGGDVNIDGKVKITGEFASADIESAYNYYTEGSLNVAGEISASGEYGSVMLCAGNGYAEHPSDLLISGRIDAKGMISATAYDQDVVVGNGARVNAEQGVSLTASRNVEADGLIKSVSAVNVTGYGKVGVGGNGTLLSTQGSIYITGKGGGVTSAGVLSAKNGFVSVAGKAGDVDLNADDTGLVVATAVIATSDQNVNVDNGRNVIDNIYFSELMSSPGATFDRDENGLALDMSEFLTRYNPNPSLPMPGVFADGNIVICDDIAISEQFDATVYSVGGDVTLLDGASLSAGNVSLVAASGNLEANGALLGKTVSLQAADEVRVGSTATVTASGMDPDRGSITLISTGGKVVVDKGATLTATAEDAQIYLGSLPQDEGVGGIVMNGVIDATVDDRSGAGEVLLKTEMGDIDVGGNVRADGLVMMMAGGIEYAKDDDGKPIRDEFGGYVEIGRVGGGDISVDGSIAADGLSDGAMVLIETMDGDVAVKENADVSAVTATYVTTEKGDISIAGNVDAGELTLVDTIEGTVSVDGSISSDSKTGLTILASEQSGNIFFGNKGRASGFGLYVKTGKGDILQDGTVSPAESKGFVTPTDYRASLVADEIYMDVGGNVGDSKKDPLAVLGKVVGSVGGNASIASADGANFVGGTSPHAVMEIPKIGAGGTLTGFLTLDFSKLDGNAALFTQGDLSIYTSGALESFNTFSAGGNLTVSAASFGDMSYLHAGGQLTINNVGKPAHPQIAYFESINGKEQRINNLPNGTVIFIDGRLAGGNLNILNKFGADEAFMVETPELKSTQGIFGNPPFLHSDLDVANPMEVSAIDYLIQEVPRLTLSSDFPDEVDQNIEASGLSQKDVYWFGQKGTDEKNLGEEPKKDTAEGEEEAEKPAAKTVAMTR